MSMTNGVLTALPAPEGYEVDFENPNQIGDVAGYIVTGIGVAVAFSFLCMRVYTRVVISRNFGLEDVCVILSFLFGMGTQSILVHLWVIKASGVHAFEMPFDRYQLYTVIIMVASIVYVGCLGFAKMSILILYHRMSKLRWFKLATFVVMGIVASYSVGIILALIFPCQPIAMNWDLSITEGKCIDKAGIYLATAAVNVITDFIILALPVPVVLGLQMRRIQKIAVLGLFMVGSATFVTSIIRLVYMIPMVSNPDQTRAVSIPTVWINVEANLVVITTSLPTLRTFLRHFFPAIFEDSTADTGPSKYYNKHGYNPSAGTHDVSKLGSHSRYGRMDSELDVEMQDNFHHGYEGEKRQQEGDRSFGKTMGLSNYRNRSEVRGDASDVECERDDGSDKAIWQTKTVTVERH